MNITCFFPSLLASSGGHDYLYGLPSLLASSGGHDYLYGLFFLIIALVIGAATSHFLKKVPLPFTVLLLLIGLGMGGLNRYYIDKTGTATAEHTEAGHAEHGEPGQGLPRALQALDRELQGRLVHKPPTGPDEEHLVPRVLHPAVPG